MNKRIIFYTILIIIVITLVFFSQQSYSQDIIKNFFSNIGKYIGATLSGGFNLNPFGANSTNDPPTSYTNSSDKLIGSAYSSSSNTNASPNVNSSVASKENWTVSSLSDLSEKAANGLKSGGEVIINSIINTKENISAAEKNIQNYFSGIADSILHPGENNDCPAQPTETTPSQ